MPFYKSILYSILFLVILELVGFWIVLVPNDNTFFTIRYSHIVNSVIQLFLVVSFFILIKRKDLYKLNKTHYKYYVIAILAGLLFPFIQPFLKIFYYFKIPPSDIFHLDFDIIKLKSLSIIASIGIVPITEELFFRNFIQSELQLKYRPIISILIASICFSLIHVPVVSLFYDYIDFSLSQSYIAIFGGIISGILYYKSKSVGPSIVFHVIWNFIVHILF